MDAPATRGGESADHHYLKLELAVAARAVGASVQLEARGPSGAWRADVLATLPNGLRVSLEAQLSHLTELDVMNRTRRMAADGVDSIWFSGRDHVKWSDLVPSARIAPAGPQIVVTGPLPRYDTELGMWRTGNPITLAEFLADAFTGNRTWYQPTIRFGGCPRKGWAHTSCITTYSHGRKAAA